MASNSTISISFKIADGADSLKKLTVEAEACARSWGKLWVLLPNSDRRL